MAWVPDCFVYQAVYTKLGTSRFCISPNESYILKIKSGYMQKRLVLLRFLDNVSSSSLSWQKEGEGKEAEKWWQITVVTEWEMWAQVFLFSVMTQNQRNTVCLTEG